MVLYRKLVINFPNKAQQITLLLVGFAAAILLRLSMGGIDVAHSYTAGLFFGVCLILLSIAVGLKTKVTTKTIITGILGGLFLLLPATFSHQSSAHPWGNYFYWAIVVSFVALAEEAFLRGVLFSEIKKWKNENLAIFVTAAAFTALHIPIYGWKVVPLDFAVGVFLGALRSISGNWISPGIAHVLADLGGWWLV